MTGIPEFLGKTEFHLYVLEIHGLGVKVGISRNPQQRFERLRKAASDHGLSTGRSWISDPHIEARANERALIALGGSGNRREYLSVGFDVAVDLAERLPRTRSSEESRAAEAAEDARRVSFFWPIGTTKEDVVHYANEVFGL